MDTFRSLTSPVLGKTVKEKLNLELESQHLKDIYKRIMDHLNKKTSLERSELKSYQKEVQKLTPNDHKNRRLRKKIKGLLEFLLKKRADFQRCIANGEIEICEQLPEMAEAHFPTPPTLTYNHTIDEEFDVPSGFLTNEDFVTPVKMEIENYSEDLFSDQSFVVLHAQSQENFHLLKSLTFQELQVPEMVQVDEIMQIHEKIDKKYTNLPTLTFPVSSERTFDNLENVTEEQFKEELKCQVEEAEIWFRDIIDKLLNLNVNECPVNAQGNEENLKTIRTVCAKLKQNLEEDKTGDRKVEIVKKLLNKSN